MKKRELKVGTITRDLDLSENTYYLVTKLGRYIDILICRQRLEYDNGYGHTIGAFHSDVVVTRIFEGEL